MDTRYRSLDLIRGFALLGVLLVNAPHFASPPAAVMNPGLAPLAVGSGTQWAWLWVHVGFEFKAISLFSMLFGASLCLVGGDGRQADKSKLVHWRLAWLAAFGLAHGLFIWWGDILFSYAIAGALVVGMRGSSARQLVLTGAGLTAFSILVLAAVSLPAYGLSDLELREVLASDYAPPPTAIATTIRDWTGSFAAIRMSNLAAWLDWQVPLLALMTPRTAGMMLIGMGLFKSGFLIGRSSHRTYAGWIAVAAISLAVLSNSALAINQAGFPLAATQGGDFILNATLSPLIAIGYAGALIQVLRLRFLDWLVAGFCSIGRMAFTHYILQSLVLSFFFWGGIGLALYGQLDRQEVTTAALWLFAAQMLTSMVWLRCVSSGPLEMLWRRLIRLCAGKSEPGGGSTSGRPVGFHGGAPNLAIETIGLGRQFGPQWAVSDLNLSVQAGTVFGFLGANGAGKTTTLKMLLGLLKPTTGEVRIAGATAGWFGGNLSGRAGARVGALLDAASIYPHLTSRENLSIFCARLELPLSQIDRVLETVGLERGCNKTVAAYSLGMRQRLGLARALLGSPPVLILDEPLNGLDPEGIADMRRLIRSLPDQYGTTVLVSSHLLSEVELTASHVGLMRAGRLVAEGSVRLLLEGAETQLRVRTLDPAITCSTIEGLGLVSSRSGPWICLQLTGGAREAAAIIARLVSAGIEVAEAVTPRSTLEDLYHRIGPVPDHGRL